MSDQKYRQRGYKDEGRGESTRRRRNQGPKPERDGPWGRGMGKPTASVFRCGDCGKRVAVAGGVEVGQTCPGCEAALHSCVNCQHFDPSAQWQCREKPPEPVRGKRKANECPLFAPKKVAEFESNATKDPEEARAAFDDLFADL